VVYGLVTEVMTIIIKTALLSQIKIKNVEKILGKPQIIWEPIIL